MQGCKARRLSDQMVCKECRLVWDVNDPEPPDCKSVTGDKVINLNDYVDSRKLTAEELKAGIRDLLKTLD